MRLPYVHDNADAAGLRVLVTGASGTFGRAIAEEFVALGAHVVGLDLMPREDDPVTVIATDITDDASVAAGVAAALADLGGLDILVNNAGTGGPGPAEYRPDAEVARQLELNLLGGWRVTAQCVPALVASRGRVVNVASRMAVMQLPLAAAYGVSKRAFVAWSDALRLELAPYVSVSVVYPSMVKSPIHDATAKAGLSLEGMSVFEPLSGVVAAVVNGGLSRYPRRDIPTSRRGEVEFFVARHFPALLDRVVERRLADRVASGAMDNAPLARGVVARLKGTAAPLGAAGRGHPNHVMRADP